MNKYSSLFYFFILLIQLRKQILKTNRVQFRIWETGIVSLLFFKKETNDLTALPHNS